MGLVRFSKCEEILEVAKKSYSKVKDAASIYKIKTKISSIKKVLYT